MCKVSGCQQAAHWRSDEGLCYFHWKQKIGLIPKEDRRYYLEPSDKPLSTEQQDTMVQFQPLIISMAETMWAKSKYPYYTCLAIQNMLLLGVVQQIDYSKTDKELSKFIKRAMINSSIDRSRTEKADPVAYVKPNSMDRSKYSMLDDVPITSDDWDLSDRQMMAFFRGNHKWRLSKTEKRVFKHRFTHKVRKTQEETAEVLRIPRTTVTMAEARALQKYKWYHDSVKPKTLSNYIERGIFKNGYKCADDDLRFRKFGSCITRDGLAVMEYEILGLPVKYILSDNRPPCTWNRSYSQDTFIFS